MIAILELMVDLGMLNRQLCQSLQVDVKRFGVEIVACSCYRQHTLKFLTFFEKCERNNKSTALCYAISISVFSCITFKKWLLEMNVFQCLDFP